MIRVTVELISAISRDRDRVLVVADISNITTQERHREARGRRGDYHARLRNRHRKVWREGQVLNHPRLSQNVWYLVAKALNAALGLRTVKAEKQVDKP